MAVATPLLLFLLLALTLAVAVARGYPADVVLNPPSEAPTAGMGGLVSATNGTGAYKGMAREFVDGHNKVRARYGVAPMRWDNKLARQARRWSNGMRGECVLRHSGGGRYAESLFIGRIASASDAINKWSTEEGIFDRQTGKCTGALDFHHCGHFAFIVRPNFSRVGCGRAECFNGGVFITCNYYHD
ncbi:pathogenesis-related protein 1-like [Oryza brachyantha]|uniref:pathogenesis-related protein 1-like n=1 Tax=Oryza brachyantha TaxID=4533 RepID=UPI001AD970B9|nr:pathogenesis-related protein 1-like [Oryza brachyantha]